MGRTTHATDRLRTYALTYLRTYVPTHLRTYAGGPERTGRTVVGRGGKLRGKLRGELPLVHDLQPARRSEYVVRTKY